MFDTDGGNVIWFGEDSATHYGLDIASDLKGLKFKGLKFKGQLGASFIVTIQGILHPGYAGSKVAFEDCEGGDLENPAQTGLAVFATLNHYFQMEIIRCKAVCNMVGLTHNGALEYNETLRTLGIVNSVLETTHESYPAVSTKSNAVLTLLAIHAVLISAGSAWEDMNFNQPWYWQSANMNSIFMTKANNIPVIKFTYAPIVITSGLASDFNCYYSPTQGQFMNYAGLPYTLEEWKAEYNIEENSFTDNPLLNADYTLQFDSPCIKKGSYIGGVDLNGNARAYGVDIGAIQTSYLRQGYCTAEDVIAYSGVTPADLQQSDMTALKNLLNGWIAETTGIIDKYVNQSWQIGSEPQEISNACFRMVANMVGLAIQRRKSPVVQTGEFNVKLVQDQVMSDDVKELLKQHRKSGSPLLAIGSTLPEDS